MLDQLWTIKSDEIVDEIASFSNDYDVFDTFESYKKVCRKCGESSSNKLQLLLAFKQVFCIPWLLCSKELLCLNTGI